MACNKIALVTGANQGIGFGIVKRLCKEHPQWTIYGTSRNEKNGVEAAAQLKADGCNVIYLKADITDKASIEAVRDRIMKNHGGLDILVNNAGMAFKQAATDPYPVKVKTTVNTNVFGTAAVCKILFPILKDGARVVILSSGLALTALHKIQKLNTEKYNAFIKTPPISVSETLEYMQDFIDSVESSSYAQHGWPDDAAYSVSKVGDTLLARAMQAELDGMPERDIVVNAVCPGYVSTSMTSLKGHLTIDEGADTPYYLATLPPKTDIKGQHVTKRQVVQWA